MLMTPPAVATSRNVASASALSLRVYQAVLGNAAPPNAVGTSMAALAVGSSPTFRAQARLDWTSQKNCLYLSMDRNGFILDPYIDLY